LEGFTASLWHTAFLVDEARHDMIDTYLLSKMIQVGNAELGSPSYGG